LCIGWAQGSAAVEQPVQAAVAAAKVAVSSIEHDRVRYRYCRGCDGVAPMTYAAFTWCFGMCPVFIAAVGRRSSI
jgi:hypothetical protein